MLLVVVKLTNYKCNYAITILYLYLEGIYQLGPKAIPYHKTNLMIVISESKFQN